MGGDDAGGQLLAASASPHADEAIAAVRDDSRFPSTPSDAEAYDDLYGDVNVGFIPLLPFTPSPAPTSPPKTPSPGRSPSPSPPPHRAPAPKTHAQQREPEPQPKPATPRHHQPPLPPPPALRHHQPPPQRPPRGGGDSYSSALPRCTALYISELHWWTTDEEVEAALAAHGAAAALYGLRFYNEKQTGKSRGICRADFLHHAAAASAAAVLHGHAFHGRRCVASLTRPPALHRLGDDSDSYAKAPRAAPNPARGLGNGGRGPTDATAVRGNVGPSLGDRPPLAPLPRPRSVVPRPSPGQPFGGGMGSVAGYGGFQSMGHYNGTMLSAVPPQMNPAFLAAGGMAMHGSGVWHGRGMSGGLWGAQHGWNFRGYQMPWQQPMPPTQKYQAQQQHGNGEYRKGRGMRQQERPSNRSEERSTGNVRYLDGRQADRDGSRQERVLEKEREQRHCNERDRHVDDKRKHQEYTECADLDRRRRVTSRSQSMDDSDDDRPRRRR
ncbi:hypothetical protein U9M48_032871 [Paspalum notatum var. saurae]|uniref:RRM domain-containing protein n=1 Tax=Paspalum notatum var. saurae TaxID=547442 RepID=A0AAQ3U5L8_PASNO